MSEYDVTIVCFGHTFNVRGVKAHNKEDAEQKALRFVKSRTTVVGSVKRNNFFKEFFDKFGIQ